jgi:hypothetical protein
LVTECDANGNPEISVAVSAYNGGIQIVNDSLFLPNEMRGNELLMLGIPPATGGDLPASPEAAANLAATTSNRRVSAVPELISGALVLGVPPQFAHWRVSLESPAVLHSQSGGTASVTELFVSVSGMRESPAAWIASLVQPDESGTSLMSSAVALGIPAGSFKLRRLARYPLSFDRSAP